MKEKGIFTGKDEQSFETDQDIKRRFALEGNLDFETPVKVGGDFHNSINRARLRSVSLQEASPRSDNLVKVNLPRSSVISFIGDVHFGHPNTNYDRIEREVEVIKNTPDSYAVLTGDLVDGIHWGGASQSEQSATLDEQHGFIRGLFTSLRGKVIAAVSGEHDSKWAVKTGSDPYSQFSEITGAPYVRGVAEIELGVGEQDYKMVVQHKAKGHSMYNKNHPTYREARFSAQGADVYVSGHTHQKQVSQEALREFGGNAREVTHISVGPYKTSDEYSERQGYLEQNENEMFGVSIRLHDDKKKVEVEPSILDAHKKWG